MTYRFNPFRALGAAWRRFVRRLRALWLKAPPEPGIGFHSYIVRHAFKPYSPNAVVAVLYRHAPEHTPDGLPTQLQAGLKRHGIDPLQ